MKIENKGEQMLERSQATIPHRPPDAVEEDKISSNQATTPDRPPDAVEESKISSNQAVVYLPKEKDDIPLLQEQGSGRWKVLSESGVLYRRTKLLEDITNQV